MTTFTHSVPPSAPAASGPMSWLKSAQSWLDARGRMAWITAMVLAFIFIWPLGLALLAYMLWSHRMFSSSCHLSTKGKFRSTGNRAFDTYKQDTLKRLEDEQQAFEAFLEQLREAKDKSEFDSFMDERAKAATSQASSPDLTTQ